MAGKAHWVFVLLVSMIIAFHGNASEVLAQNTVKIGAVQALKGVFAEAFFHVNDGLKDSLAIANEEGGINGKRIEYIMEPCDYNVDDEKQKFDAIYAAHRPLAMFGCSTGFGLSIRDQLKEKYKVLYGSTSFAADLALGGENSAIFLSGPSYGDQIAILLKYIAKTKKDAKVAFFHSDTPFGMDGIKYGQIVAQRLRLAVVADVTVNLKEKDYSKEVALLKEKNPDFVIFHGFVLRPVPEVIRLCKEQGMTCKFMGLFWTATKTVLDQLGPLADGYMVVNPYAYWGMNDIPMIRKIMSYNAKNHPDVKYRPNAYMQGFLTGMIFVEVLKRADKAGELNYDGMVKALHSVRGLDTGGLTAPLTIKNNRFPVARVWAANASTGDFEPAPLPPGMETWITVPE
jgi:branched-chain amino acid transport system substrate-binding protein